MRPKKKMTPDRSSTPLYGVITADLVESRRMPDRAGAQEQLSGLVKRLNIQLAQRLVAPFMVTLGDEIQGMLDDVDELPATTAGIHEVFHPREISVGVGIGTIATRLVRRVTEMDGPVFINSRTALDIAKKERLEVVVRTGDTGVDEVLNAIYGLLCGIKAGWTRTQWQRFNLYRELETVEAVARRLGVAKQSVSKSLRNTLWLRVLDVEAKLPHILSRIRGDSQTGSRHANP